LTLEEKKMILNLRNNKNIKKWMYNQDEISLDEHLKFIQNLEFNPFKQYLIVKKGNEFIGVIDFIFDYQKKEAFFG
jgi:UDP-4-amino-4,6-dideoxy-N-acetyl-beta-L-altrosamine N-acetyltransferase